MSDLSYRTLREKVVDEIRRKILNGELEPGIRVVEQNLSEEFGISRGPIREALRQLEQEGLVEYARNAGCTVKDVTIEDVYEIYLLRSTYEVLSVKLIQGAFSEADLLEMERILKQMKDLKEGENEKLVLYDHKLHEIIVRQAGMSRIEKAWAELKYGSDIANSRSGSFKKTLIERQYLIHRKLVDACKTKNTVVICQAISDHYVLPAKKLAEENGIIVKTAEWNL